MSPEKTYGSLVLGSLFASFLSGLTTLQAVLYFRLFSQDPRSLKIIVLIVWALDLLHTAFMWEGMWFYVVKNFGDESKIEVINYCIPGVGITTAIVTIITHCFYVNRIFRLSNRRYCIAIPIFVVAFVRMCGAFVASGLMIRIPTFPPVLSQFSYVVTIPLSLSCAADVLITLSMFVLLRMSQHQSRTLGHILDRLVLYTLEMGTLTGCAAIIAMLCWVLVPNKLVFLGLYFTIGKFYANSLLGLLNARYHLRNLQHVNQPGVSSLNFGPVPIGSVETRDNTFKRVISSSYRSMVHYKSQATSSSAKSEV